MKINEQEIMELLFGVLEILKISQHWYVHKFHEDVRTGGQWFH